MRARQRGGRFRGPVVEGRNRPTVRENSQRQEPKPVKRKRCLLILAMHGNCRRHGSARGVRRSGCSLRAVHILRCVEWAAVASERPTLVTSNTGARRRSAMQLNHFAVRPSPGAGWSPSGSNIAIHIAIWSKQRGVAHEPWCRGSGQGQRVAPPLSGTGPPYRRPNPRTGDRFLRNSAIAGGETGVNRPNHCIGAGSSRYYRLTTRVNVATR